MVIKAHSRFVLAGVSALALLAPAAALAQAAPPVASTTDASAADIGDTNEVIVTARRRDEAVQDVPAVVNPVTAEQLAKLNYRQFQEVQTSVPGLNLTTVANGTGGGATLRGVNFDINASGNNPTVEFYQNDAPITAGVVLQQIYDIGQIEVLRGPQGTLRGRASPSGSITVTTRKPDLYRAGGYASVTGNDIGTINANGALSLPIVEGIFAVRVAGVVNQDDLDRIRTIASTGTTLDARRPYSETESGRITGVFQPIDALHFEGSFERLDRFNRTFDQVESFSLGNPSATPSPVLIRPGDRLSNQGIPRSVHQRYDIYNGRAELALAGQRLIYQFQHYSQKILSYLSNDTAEIYGNVDFGQTTNSRPTSTSHEVRLQNNERVLGIFDYVIGGFNQVNNVPTDLVIGTPIFLPSFLGGGLATISNSNIARRGNSNEKSAFGNITAHLGTQIELSGGLRYISYKSTGLLVIPSGAGPVTLVDPPKNLNHVIYTASAQYFLKPGIMLYASTGTSFRPGIDAVGDFNLTPSARENSFVHLGNETSQSYEAGIKTTLFDDRAHFNVSGFHQTFNNYPYRTPGQGIYYVNTTSTSAGNTQTLGQFNFVAAVPVTVNGVEGEFGFDFSRQFKVNLVAAYALGKINNGTIACNDLNGDGVPDAINSAPTVAQLQAAYGANNVGSCKVTQRSAFQSPISASGTAEYTHPVTDHVDGYVRGIASFNGRSQNDPTNPYDDFGAYAIGNLYLGIRDPKGAWEVSLFAKNITNETAVLSRNNPESTTVQVLQPPTFRTVAAVSTNSTYTVITTTPPREFGLNVRFAFGSR